VIAEKEVAGGLATQAAAQGGFNAALFARLYAAEDRHFWFRARNRILGTVLGQIERALQRPYNVVEVGCGTGVVLKGLPAIFAQGLVVGLDLHPDGLAFARRRTRAPLVAGDVGSLPFRAKFDVAGMFDVLEHVPDDAGILLEVRRLLQQSGYLVLTVPAHPSLWSYADDVAQHCRRYTPRTLTDVLNRSGFHVEYLTQFMTLLYPLMWLVRRRGSGPVSEKEKVDRSGAELRIVPGFNEIMAWTLAQEWRPIAKRWQLPIGTSLLAIARPVPFPATTASQ
jgi:SAM-dependent methyltransferase